MLIKAITQTLKRAYPELRVYTERVVKGMHKPCFSVIVIDAAQSQLVGNRFRALWMVAVRYFPLDDGSKSSYEELHEVAQDLYGILDEVRFQHEDAEDDTYLGTRMSHRIEDNVLHFMVSYPFMLKKKLQPVTKQGQLTNITKVGERV